MTARSSTSQPNSEIPARRRRHWQCRVRSRRYLPDLEAMPWRSRFVNLVPRAGCFCSGPTVRTLRTPRRCGDPSKPSAWGPRRRGGHDKPSRRTTRFTVRRSGTSFKRFDSRCGLHNVRNAGSHRSWAARSGAANWPTVRFRHQATARTVGVARGVTVWMTSLITRQQWTKRCPLFARVQDARVGVDHGRTVMPSRVQRISGLRCGRRGCHRSRVPLHIA
jgi:hypothetical protein